MKFFFLLPFWKFNRGRGQAPDNVRIFVSIMSLSSVNPIFDRLLESSHRDDSNKWSNIGFTEEITQVVPIEVFFFLEIFNRGSSLGLPQCSYGAAQCRSQRQNVTEAGARLQIMCVFLFL